MDHKFAYYSHNGSKLFIDNLLILPNSFFLSFKFSFPKMLLCIIPFSFDYIHKNRQK